MTRTSRSVSFTPEHYNLLDRIAREKRRGFSEILRCIIDHAIDRDATLGLPFYAERVKSLQAELVTAQEAIKSLEQQTPVDAPKVFEEVTKPTTNPKPSFVDKRPGSTEEERFLKLVRYVTNADADKVVTPELKKKVLDQAREHPEWLAQVPEPQRSQLTIMSRGAPR